MALAAAVEHGSSKQSQHNVRAAAFLLLAGKQAACMRMQVSLPPTATFGGQVWEQPGVQSGLHFGVFDHVILTLGSMTLYRVSFGVSVLLYFANKLEVSLFTHHPVALILQGQYRRDRGCLGLQVTTALDSYPLYCQVQILEITEASL